VSRHPLHLATDAITKGGYLMIRGAGQMGDEPPSRELDGPDTPPSDIEREGHDSC